MAGKLNTADMMYVLEALRGVNRSLGSCVESLGDCQKKLEKSIQCQDYLNISLKPVQTGFVPKENEEK